MQTFGLPYFYVDDIYLTNSEITDHSSNFSSEVRLQVLDVEESNTIFPSKSIVEKKRLKRKVVEGCFLLPFPLPFRTIVFILGCSFKKDCMSLGIRELISYPLSVLPFLIPLCTQSHKAILWEVMKSRLDIISSFSSKSEYIIFQNEL